MARLRLGRTRRRPRTRHNLQLDVRELPKLDIGVSELPKLDIGVSELPKLDIGVSELPKVRAQLDPVELRLTAFPSLRVHLPVNYRIGFCFLGREYGSIRLCGEAQLITEPYVPNPCECSEQERE